MSVRRVPLIVVAAWLLLAPAAAQARQNELNLTWRAPSGCPDNTQVEAQFDRLLGGPNRVPTSKVVTARATAREMRVAAWTVDLETNIDGVAGRRRVESDSCWAVASMTALILALAVDPTAAARAAEDPPAAPAPPPPPVIVAAPTPPPPPPAPPLRLVVRAFSTAVLGLLPQSAFAGGLGVGARRGRFDAELGGLLSMEVEGQSPRASAGGDFRLAVASARACAAITERPVVARACAGGAYERITARGFGVTAPGSGTSTGIAGLVSGGAALPLGPRLELFVEATGAFRGHRPTFALDPVGSVFTVPAASAYLTLGLAAAF